MIVNFETPVSDKRRKELTEAANFFANLLMDPRMVRGIQLDIGIVNRLDVMGECVDEDGTRNPRWFTINLRNKRDDDDLVKTLAHEMVHVKQHAKNELSSGHMVASKGGVAMRTKWQGKIWKPKSKENGYWDSPWEIEAYGREVGLYQRWLQHKGFAEPDLEDVE